MTTDEAKAFVGDVPCIVNTLEDDKLYLEPPPEHKVRLARNDGTSEPLKLKVGPPPSPSVTEASILIL